MPAGLPARRTPIPGQELDFWEPVRLIKVIDNFVCRCVYGNQVWLAPAL